MLTSRQSSKNKDAFKHNLFHVVILNIDAAKREKILLNYHILYCNFVHIRGM